MQLIYRGEVIEYNAPTIKPYQKPAALNWRYHAPGETYNTLTVKHTMPPRALNWRWQPL